MGFFSNRIDSGGFLNSILTRKQRKWIGWALIALAVLFAMPPAVPTIVDDLAFNVPVAMLLVSYGVQKEIALVLTYTLLPFLIFVAGVAVFPAKDGTVAVKAKRFFLKAIKFAAKKMRNPIFLIAAAVAIYFIYTFYLGMLAKAGLI